MYVCLFLDVGDFMGCRRSRVIFVFVAYIFGICVDFAFGRFLFVREFRDILFIRIMVWRGYRRICYDEEFGREGRGVRLFFGRNLR